MKKFTSMFPNNMPLSWATESQFLLDFNVSNEVGKKRQVTL